MATPTSNYQFGFNGWLFGNQTGIQLLSATGLEDLPTLRTQDDTLGYIDGQLTGRDFLNGRTITLHLLMTYDGTNSAQANLAALKTYLAPQQQGTGLLQLQLPSRSLQRVQARVRKRAINLDPMYTYGYITAVVELFAPDPRIYDDAVQSTNLAPVAGLGRTYNRTYNLTYTSSTGTVSQSGTFTNSGNTSVYPIFTVSGAMTNPIITNSTTGQYLQLNITTAIGDTIIIDPSSRSITYNGNPARNILAGGSSWFGFPPGSTTVATIAGAVDPAAYVNVSFRNGYI
jgi:hypothetical protein